MQQLIAWWMFAIRGWKIEGKFHFELPKSIMIVAPHTHWVDFFIGIAVRKKMGFEFESGSVFGGLFRKWI